MGEKPTKNLMAKTKEKVETLEVKISQINVDLEKTKKQGVGLLIKTEAEYQEAVDYLANFIKPRIVKIKGYIEKYSAPFIEARRVALAEVKKIENEVAVPLNGFLEIEKNIKENIVTFLRNKELEAKKEEARLAKLREKQDDRREAKGLAPIATPVATVARVATTVKTEEGGKTVAKKVWNFEIKDASKLPDNVKAMVFQLALDEGLVAKVVRNLVKDGCRDIQGVRIYEDFNVNVTAQR